MRKRPQRLTHTLRIHTISDNSITNNARQMPPIKMPRGEIDDRHQHRRNRQPILECPRIRLIGRNAVPNIGKTRLPTLRRRELHHIRIDITKAVKPRGRPVRHHGRRPLTQPLTSSGTGLDHHPRSPQPLGRNTRRPTDPIDTMADPLHRSSLSHAGDLLRREPQFLCLRHGEQTPLLRRQVSKVEDRESVDICTTISA